MSGIGNLGMARPWTWRSPDSRLADIKYARDLEEERSAGLDELDNQRERDIQRQFQVELQRSATLDQQDDIGRQMEVEEARNAALDRRDEVEQRQQPPARMTPLQRTMQERWDAGVGEEVAGRGIGLPGMPFGLGRPLKTVAEPAYEYGVKPAVRGVQYVEEPIAAAALGAVSRAGPLGGPALGPTQQITETPMERAPIGEELVNPVSAWLGDEEEQRKAREVLDEAGLPAELMAYFFTSPLNLLPVVGFTSGRGFLNTLRQATRVTGEARTAIVRSPRFQRTIQAITSEAGGPRVPGGVPEPELGGFPERFAGKARALEGGPPTEPPKGFRLAAGEEPPAWYDVAVNIARRFPTARKTYKNIKLARRAEMSKRTRNYMGVIDEQLNKGVELEDAKRVAAREYRGEMPDIEFAEAFITTPDELAALNRRGLEYARETGHVHEWEDAYNAIVAMADKRVPRPHEIKAIRRIFGDELADTIAQAAKDKDWWDTFMELWMLPKAVRSSFDISFPGRQGIMPGFRHPLMWSKGVINSVRAYKNPDWMLARMKRLLGDPTPYGVKMPDGSVQQMRFGDILDGMDVVPIQVEPYYRSQLAERLPFIGRHVYRSRVSFTGVGGEFRADMTRHWLDVWTRAGVDITPERLEKLGTLMNALTGRATLPTKGWLFDVLQATWWSPQYRLAGPQVVGTTAKHGLGALPLRPGFRPLVASADPYIAGIAAQNLVAFVGGGVGILAMLKASGLADVELDPRSTDFGKVRVGPARVNFWGTSQLLVRTIAQAVTGTRIDPQLGPQALNRHEPFARYWQSGASPEFQIVTDLVTGQTYLGRRMYPSEERGIGLEEIARREFDPSVQEGGERILPLAWLDIKEAIEENALSGAFYGALGMIGVGVQTYEPRAAQELQNIPEFTGGLNQRQITEVGDFLREVDEIRDEWRLNQGREVGVEEAIRYVGEYKQLDPNFIEWVVRLRYGTKSREKLRNPEWTQFIVEHADEIRQDRPDLLRRDYIIEALRESR